jgi:hypothetical protein
MVVLELTPDEALNLRNLLDAAVRGGGMRAAEAAIVIDQKILAAAKLWEAQQGKPGNGRAAEPPPIRNE